MDIDIDMGTWHWPTAHLEECARHRTPGVKQRSQKSWTLLSSPHRTVGARDALVAPKPPQPRRLRPPRRAKGQQRVAEHLAGRAARLAGRSPLCEQALPRGVQRRHETGDEQLLGRRASLAVGGAERDGVEGEGRGDGHRAPKGDVRRRVGVGALDRAQQQAAHPDDERVVHELRTEASR